MTLTIADKYYLKAKDHYHYDLEIAVDNLNYALGYDPEHTEAIFLMAELYVDYMQDLDKAEEYFQLGFQLAPKKVAALEKYAELLWKKGEVKKLTILMKYYKEVKGSSLAFFYFKMGRVKEFEKQFVEALHFFDLAMQHSYKNEFITFLEDEIRRVKKKESRALRVVYNAE